MSDSDDDDDGVAAPAPVEAEEEEVAAAATAAAADVDVDAVDVDDGTESVDAAAAADTGAAAPAPDAAAAGGDGAEEDAAMTPTTMAITRIVDAAGDGQRQRGASRASTEIVAAAVAEAMDDDDDNESDDDSAAPILPPVEEKRERTDTKSKKKKKKRKKSRAATKDRLAAAAAAVAASGDGDGDVEMASVGGKKTKRKRKKTRTDSAAPSRADAGGGGDDAATDELESSSLLPDGGESMRRASFSALGVAAAKELADVQHGEAVDDEDLAALLDADELGELVSDRELRAWYMFDWADSVFYNSVIGSLLPAFMLSLAEENVDDEGKVSFLGLRIEPASFFSYCVSTSVMIQLIVFVSVGAMADFGKMRKNMLMASSTIGAVATCAFVLCTPSVYWFAGLLLIVSNVSYGTATIFYNSFLPLLVKNLPQVRSLTDVKLGIKPDAEQAALVPKYVPDEEKWVEQPEALTQEIVTIIQLLDSRLSTYGFMYGYAGGTLLLIINVVLFFVFPAACEPRCDPCFYGNAECPDDCEDDYDPTDCDGGYTVYRFNICLAGMWWLLFSLYTFRYLLPRRSKELPAGTTYLAQGLRQVRATLADLRKLPNSFRFLAAFWFYSDGFATINSAAAIAAVELLGVSGLELGIGFLISNIMALGGVYVYMWFDHRYAWVTARRVVMTCICITCTIPLYVRLPGTMTATWEFYVIAAVFGVQNAYQTYSRVLLSRLCPEGHEGEFFSFYELSDKGTSWLGPLAVGLVMDITGDIRWSVFVVLFFLLLGLSILYFVVEEDGIEEVAAFEVEEKAARRKAKLESRTAKVE